MTERAVRLAQRLGYPAFALGCFVVALYLTFPYDRVRERLEREAGAAGYDVTIGSLGPAALIGLSAEDVAITIPGSRPGDQPTRYLLDEITLKPGLLAMLRGVVRVAFSADLGDGEIEGTYEQGRERSEVELEVSAVALRDVPGLGEIVPLPLGGALDGKARLELPRHRLSEAEGSIELDCHDCSVGDGKAKLVIPGGDAFLAQGITVPRLRLGQFGGAVTVEKGTARFQAVEARSPDGDVAVEGTLDLREPLPYSMARLYLRFRLSDDLRKREPKLAVLEKGIPAIAKRDDGWYGYQLVGSLRAARPRPSRFAPAGGGLRSTRSAPGGGPYARPPRSVRPPRETGLPAAAPLGEDDGTNTGDAVDVPGGATFTGLPDQAGGGAPPAE